MKLWLLHPMVVHFPIALLTTGFAAQLRALVKGEGDWAAPAARALLWLGSAAAWTALGLGHLAARTASHVPAAWETMADHKTLAWWTSGVFTAASAVAFWLWRHAATARRWERGVLVAVWLVGLGLLVATADHGGDLVYDFNLGTAATAE